MHRTLRSAHPAAALALAGTLALAATLVVPGAAFAGTTEATPVTTTGSTTSSTTSSTSTSSATTTSTGSSTTASTTPSTTASTTPSTTASTTASTTTTPSTTTAKAKSKAKLSTGSKAVRPFGASSSLRAALVPGDTSDQAAYAAGFIVRTLAAREDHYNYPRPSTYFDGGNTVDAVLALDGAGAGLDQADATTDYLAAHVDDYVGYADPPGSPTAETYAGPLGKLVLGVVAQGGDPTDFGGQDLVARLEGLMTVDGRFSDKSSFGDATNPSGDYSNTIGQVLDVIALGRATGSVPDAAGAYLLDQQCSDGGFRGNLDVAGAACTSDADATAFAAQALVGLLGTDDPATLDALDWLSSHQAPNGGFRNDDGQYNANTAGVAAQAFAAGGLDAELARAQDFLAGLQFDCSFAAGLRGGIAFTAADYKTLKAAPKTTAAVDRALRATPQATLGLAGDSLLTVTADGASASAPTLECRASPTTTTSPVSSTSTSSTPETAAHNPADAASATPGSLALTGTNVAAMTLLATLLLLAGAGATVLARRKGVHA